MHSEDITAEQWILTPKEQNIVMGKHHAQRLSFGLQIVFYRVHGRFPAEITDIEPAVVAQIAQQLRVPVVVRPHAIRTGARHRIEIRTLFGFREASVADADMLTAWLSNQVIGGAAPDHPVALLETRCRELSIEPPSDDRIDRIVRAAIHAHEERFCAGVVGQLSSVVRARLGTLLYPEGAEQCEVERRMGRKPRQRSFCDCVAIRDDHASPRLRNSWLG
jgi:hypothetical protein